MATKRGLGWLAAFVLLLAVESAYCFLHPIAYFDTVAYASLASNPERGNDFGMIGAACPQALPGAYSGCGEVLSSEIFRQASALTPAEYRQFLRFYTVKPLYNGLVRTGFLLDGGRAFLALRIVSALSFAAIGLLCVFRLRDRVSPALASVGSLCLISLPGVIALGRGLLPDALLTALLLLGAYLLVFRQNWYPGAAVLFLATLVRPDALLFAVAYGAVRIGLEAHGRVRWQRLAMLAGGAILWTLLLGRLTGALPWRVLFVHSFLRWTPPGAYGSLHLTAQDYLQVMSSNGVRTVLFCLPLPGLLALLALSGRRIVSPAVQVVWAGLAAVLVRVLLFPGVEERYYVWLTLLAGVQAIAALHRGSAPSAQRAEA